MTARMILAGLLIAAPAFAGTAFAGSDTAKPAGVSTEQSTPAPSTTTPNATPLPSDVDTSYPGGCPFGHQKSKSAAIS